MKLKTSQFQQMILGAINLRFNQKNQVNNRSHRDVIDF